MLYRTPVNKVSASAEVPLPTSLANGYIEEATGKLAPASSNLVVFTGQPEWVQVHSKDKESKFTNLSTSQISIVRANNPKVLKTAYSLQTQTFRMDKAISLYPDAAIMNASGFTGTIGAIGFQINNGKVFNDWNSANESTFVINKDGTCAAYTAATSADTIIKNGAAMSFSFGSILIQNGQVLPNDGTIGWEKHSFIANDKNNNIYLIVIKANTGYDTLISTVSKYNLENMVAMDAGGSSMLSLQGKVLSPSEDNRAVGDYIILK